MKAQIKLRAFRSRCVEDLIHIFTLSIKSTCAKDYSKEQIEAWLSGVDKTKWRAMFKDHYSMIALKDNTPIGFGDISEDGYLNMLYVHPDYQNQGVATRICDALEQRVEKNITVDASITAKDFFLKRGYAVVTKQTVYRKGIALNNFRMMKQYGNPEIGKRYGNLTIIEDTGKKYHSTKIYKCRCNCGNVCYVNAANLTNGTTVSCGGKNDENRARLPSLDRGLVDGTMKCALKKDRKLNKNNSSGVMGVHYDKTRKQWVAKRLFYLDKLKSLIGQKVKVFIDRPIGYDHDGTVYPLNYGYIKEIKALDGEYQDAYILGIDKPIKTFEGKVIAIINRKNDVEDKLVVCDQDKTFSKDEIKKAVNFQEKYFKSKILLPDNCASKQY